MAKRILVIDDDPVTVHWLQARLKAGGFDVLVAVDGVSGLEMARKENPDLITLDIMMPGLNGYSVCGFLRTDQELYDVPIIIITSRKDECDGKFDDDFSPNAFITKPFDIEEVFAKITELS